MHTFRLARLLLTGSLVLIAACGPAGDVKVQPLPPLASLSPEARAGVPVVSGVWRFAGWEVSGGDSTSLAAPLPGFGAILLRTQQRDSIGGSYVVGGGSAPLAGEVRRDGTIALVTYLAPGDGRYLAGRLEKDTIWVEMSSLTEPGSWPRGARAAFVRSAVAGRFARMRGALPPLARVDSVRADSLRADSLALARSAAQNAALQPGLELSQPAAVRPSSAQPSLTQPPRQEATPPTARTQAPPEAADTQPAQPQVSPPAPRPTIPKPALPDSAAASPASAPPLLGVPVPSDSSPGDTGANPG
jgi:hypothetical protein